MKIEIKKVLKPLWLRDYAEEYGENKLLVWVNPPQGELQTQLEGLSKIDEMRNRLVEMLREKDNPQIVEQIKSLSEEMRVISDGFVTWLACIWSQGEPETHMNADELHEFIEQSNDSDPRLYPWLMISTIEMITEHRSQQKKR